MNKNRPVVDMVSTKDSFHLYRADILPRYQGSTSGFKAASPAIRVTSGSNVNWQGGRSVAETVAE